jgi:hypothetical protein
MVVMLVYRGIKDHKGCLAIKEVRVRRVIVAFRGMQDWMVLLERMVLMGTKEHKGLREQAFKGRRVMWGLAEQMVYKALRVPKEALDCREQ